MFKGLIHSHATEQWQMSVWLPFNGPNSTDLKCCTAGQACDGAGAEGEEKRAGEFYSSHICISELDKEHGPQLSEPLKKVVG